MSLAVFLAFMPSQRAQAGDLPTSPERVTFDINKNFEDVGHSIAHVREWVSNNHDSAVANAVPDIRRSLAILADRNRRVAKILKDVRANHYVLNVETQFQLQMFVGEMQEGLRLFNRAVSIIPGGAVKPRVVESLFEFEGQKAEMLRGLAPLTSTPGDQRVDPVALDAYIAGLTKLAKAADDAYAAMPGGR